MKTNNFFKKIVFLLVIIITFSNCTNSKSNSQNAEVESLKNELASILKANEIIAKNIETFDELDFVIYSNQEWTRLHESHSHDILVHYPDGHTTKGIEAHIEELKPIFVFAPDTRIEEHPIKFGSRNLTAVIGELKGTFTKPMPIGNGKYIQPSGKSFVLPMATIGLWNEKGVMYEEYLFWDNQAFMKQIGLAN